MIYAIIGAALFITAVVFCFIPRGWAALTAFAGMVMFRLGGYAPVATEQLWFWGAASVIVLGIAALLPVPVATSRRGVAYIVVGAIAGLTVGLIISANVMILGGSAGAFCGALAYSRTPAGTALEFPSRRFLNYLCAKALPPLITLSVIAVTIVLALGRAHSSYLI